jgi:ribonuclease HI
MEIYYCDGSTLHNGDFGNQVSRVCVTTGEGKLLVDHIIGDKTNIEAEGFAILASIKQHKKTGKKECEIRTDSNFWARAIQFRWKLKEQRLFPLRDLIYAQVDEFKPKVIWIPREQNPAGQYLEANLNKKTKKQKDQPKTITCPHCGKPIVIGYKPSDVSKA